MKIIKPLTTEAEYDAAVARIEEIFEAAPGTPAGDELHILTLLVKEYDEQHYSIGNPDPIEAIKIRMEDLGWKDKDLVPFIGDKATVSKILNRKRPLTLEMVRKLAAALSLPAEVLIKEYALAA
ncbi:helix-turn-helix domain-containing protein [Adhaeribacter soli]|uniref:HTH cro/C1-type domain-containing protein n=1 Tax=Adhaeribacter soli TaxID=2607655 RepID=A0A5N1J7Y2_9BACT|nr:hypothetical protein [Adhaeribacter soli]KAA9340920.1 hypothetical protein F0P94_05705 [Adhaeribacter soli]